MAEAVTLVSMGLHTRLGDILEHALGRRPFTTVAADALGTADLRSRRLLFALSVDQSGVSPEYDRLLRRLRTEPDALSGSVGAFLVDGESELYTRGLMRTLALAADMAGCRLIGRPLVEATKTLKNFDVLYGAHGADRFTAYQAAAASLIDRLMSYEPRRFARPRLLMLHASHPERSNSLDVGRRLAELLKHDMDVDERSLSQGVVYDCSDCGRTDCAHFSEQERCFYGGQLSPAVCSAVGTADALLLLCPNTYDAPGAYISALMGRMDALLPHDGSPEKTLFAVVVSAYSGGDTVAEQLLSGFCLGNSFSLPPRFACFITANDPGEALSAPNAKERIEAFAAHMRESLVSRTD